MFMHSLPPSYNNIIDKGNLGDNSDIQMKLTDFLLHFDSYTCIALK